jgi:hypothetical protein
VACPARALWDVFARRALLVLMEGSTGQNSKLAYLVRQLKELPPDQVCIASALSFFCALYSFILRPPPHPPSASPLSSSCLLQHTFLRFFRLKKYSIFFNNPRPHSNRCHTTAQHQMLVPYQYHICRLLLSLRCPPPPPLRHHYRHHHHYLRLINRCQTPMSPTAQQQMLVPYHHHITRIRTRPWEPLSYFVSLLKKGSPDSRHRTHFVSIARRTTTS